MKALGNAVVPQVVHAIGAAILAVALAGCAEVPPAELAWQGLHVVDTLQTAQIAHSDCFHESAPGTKQLIGRNPGLAGALAWGVGAAVAHYGVTRYLIAHDAPPWLVWVFESVTIARSAYYVKNNHDQGIGVFQTDYDCR